MSRAEAHTTMRKALTTAVLSCELAAGHPSDEDDRELYRILEITLREAGELLNALDLSLQKSALRSACQRLRNRELRRRRREAA